MLVTSLEQIGKRKYKVYLDYDFFCVMYDSQIYQYELETDSEISSEQYEQILKEYAIPTVRRKGLDLLKSSDKSEWMLRRKLAESFSEELVQVAIDYLNSYRYIDDARYARSYYEAHKMGKSLTEIVMRLKNDGVSKEVLSAALAEVSSEDTGIQEEQCPDPEGAKDVFEANEIEAIRRILWRKNYYSSEEQDYETRMKIKASLLRKGYSKSLIEEAMRDNL